MDQSAALGGLMMLVIAVLWVVVFIPSWFQNRVDAEQHAQESNGLKSQVRDIKISANAPVASRLRLATER
jgi:low temperature requirement protein LtrA